MKRMHLKKHKKYFIFNKWILILILVIISIIILLKYFNKKSYPLFYEYASIETNKLVSFIVSNSILEDISNSIDENELFTSEKDIDNNIKSIDFNTVVVNKLLFNVNEIVKENLIELENDKEKTILYIPSGLIFNNNILYNLFPKIPVKLNVLGNTYSVLNTDVSSYGINNSIIKVNIDIYVDVKILFPFTSDKLQVVTSIPIIIKIIEGKIPNYYNSDYLQDFTLS